MAGLMAGNLDREVEIQQLTVAESGYPIETWQTLDDLVWMSRQDLRGRESFRTAQLSAAFDTRWEMHWREDMDPDIVDVPNKRRLLYRGRVYDITAAIEIGRQEGIALFTLAASGVSE